MAFFRWLARLWDRFLMFLGLRNKPLPPRSKVEALPPVPEIDHGELYVWECRQFRSNPTAFWFDHDRYKDTPQQWPDPPEWALRKAFDEAIAEARESLGEGAVANLIKRLAGAPEFKHPEPSNPIPYLIKHFDVKPSKGRFQTPG